MTATLLTGDFVCPRGVLRDLLERLATDATFAEQLKADPAQVLEGLDLSATERVALAANDEEALRRLAGWDTGGFLGGLDSFMCSAFCQLKSTPPGGCPPVGRAV